ncbi:MAG TPA: sigma-54 dependent transcriptional regulator [Oligoflexia bacterium]|nr:sigma-54 dependent transcriptional regulator [Oligoflexia bacterium]
MGITSSVGIKRPASLWIRMSSKPTILIIDDEQVLLDLCKLHLSAEYDLLTATSGSSGLGLLAEKKPNLILLDLYLPDCLGNDLLPRLKQSGIPLVVLSGAGSIEHAVDSIKKGAIDFICKPFDFDGLKKYLSDLLIMPSAQSSFVGESPKITEVKNTIKLIASKVTTVLISGESGTGKDLIAKEIHLRSSRASAPFVAVNCAAIPDNLIEAEFFGYAKGSFTGAEKGQIGFFQAANGGTLFLDEIGELPLALQAKLLRALQDQEFYPVGSRELAKVDVRIIAATNKNLKDLIAQKKFREDLYYRINVFQIDIPPLRQRMSDLPLLCESLLRKIGYRYSRPNLKCLNEVLEVFVNYDWPGNVRELEHTLESMVAMSESDQLSFKELPARFKTPPRLSSAIEVKLESSFKVGSLSDISANLERDLILNALKESNFVQTRAAEKLGISRRILRYKMSKLGIQP